MTDAAVDASEHWNREYASKGIPSSWKDEPSTVVRWGLTNLKFLGLTLRPDHLVLDVGCGAGRNTIAIAREYGVHAIGFDYSREAIDRANRALTQEDPFSNRVRFISGDSRDGLPVSDRSVALALDIFVYFHLLRSEDRYAYRRELARAIDPNGFCLLSLATRDDGYYSSCPIDESFTAEAVPVVVDSIAGVGNIMHTEQTLYDELGDTFTPLMSWRKVVDGPMHGATYRRVTFAVLCALKDE